MKHQLMVFFLICASVGSLYSISQAESMPRMRLDTVRFIEPDGQTRLDIPLSIFRARLYYRTDSSGNRFTSYRFRVRAYQDTSIVFQEIWDRIHRPGINENTAKGIIPDLASVVLPNGSYRVEVELTDSLGHFRERKVFDSLRFDSTTRFSISGLQVCSEISPDSSVDEFRRNGYLLVPYAEKVFGKAFPILYLYWEQYNQKPDSLCRYQISVLSSRSQTPVKPTVTREKVIVANRTFNVEALRIHDLPTGSFLVKVNSQAFPSGRIDSSFSRFFIYSDSISPLARSQKPVQPAYNPAIILLSDIHYIADQSILDAVAKLTPEEQRTWAVNFWRDRDPTPSTPYNESMEQYRTRLETVETYTYRDKPGWQTDRGRVMLFYGPPDDITDNAFESSITTEESNKVTGSNRPYIVWKYNNIGGGAFFVFGDLRLFGDYELLHSTMPGERQDESWYRRLRGVK